MDELKLFNKSIQNVTHVNGVISQGVTEPVKAILDNGDVVVVKYPYNRCGTVVLLRELIGSCLGELLSIPIPEYGLCYLSEKVISMGLSNMEEIPTLDNRNAGICFYTKLYENTSPVQSEWLKSRNTYE